ncbi:hypothetical protein [Mucilaginibacter sp.]|uniref:hypothetical protein n=1 Tax=Mucilaginibacter sp. TaxID=1882438 RepID=UPI0026165211|nr:hypothetical protein [Mucilaginibacter sp.]MDB5029614.1 hypothetical protein [Mucilaginibacter sp.]
MKKKLVYLLPLLMALAVSCVKQAHDPSNDISNYPYPLGTFSGKFTRIHKNIKTLKLDTATAAIQLVLSTATGYAVTGDTATVHAGSYGSFSENAFNIVFNDSTYPLMGFPKKTHLAGVYAYSMSGLNFTITATDGDSLAYKYDLTKTSN